MNNLAVLSRMPVRVANYAQRTIQTMFGGMFAGQKHDHYADFGWPADVNFDMVYGMYTRNSIARAAVDKTIRKSWQDPPWLLETPRDGSEGPLKKETRLEKAIRQHFSKIRFWTKVMEADRRSLVGRYAAIILRVKDGKQTDQPLTTVSGGLDALVDIIPVWEGQLRVKEYNTDQMSIDYGEPLMYEYDESRVAEPGSAMDGNARNRKLTVHPSRIIIWSNDGSLDNDSSLRPGFNDLLTLEKITGAGGEGFWRNSKQSPILEMDKEADVAKMARAMGVEPKDVFDAMTDQVKSWQRDFDELLMIQGMTAKLPKVELPDPQFYFSNTLQSFAASYDIPLKVLIGTQTGERASSEDASQWNQTNNFRRKNYVIPNILRLVSRLEECGIIKVNPEWFVDWTDLTESTMFEKIERAGKMAKVNKDAGDVVFMPREMRATVGYEPADEAEIAKLREAKLAGEAKPGDGSEDDPEDPPAPKEDDK